MHKYYIVYKIYDSVNARKAVEEQVYCFASHANPVIYDEFLLSCGAFTLFNDFPVSLNSTILSKVIFQIHNKYGLSFNDSLFSNTNLYFLDFDDSEDVPYYSRKVLEAHLFAKLKSYIDLNRKRNICLIHHTQNKHYFNTIDKLDNIINFKDVVEPYEYVQHKFQNA